MNKEVLPLKLNLTIAENKLIAAKKELATAEGKLRRKEKSLNKCKEIYCQMLITNVSFKETMRNEIKQWTNGIGNSMHSKRAGHALRPDH